MGIVAVAGLLRLAARMGVLPSWVLSKGSVTVKRYT